MAQYEFELVVYEFAVVKCCLGNKCNVMGVLSVKTEDVIISEGLFFITLIRV